MSIALTRPVLNGSEMAQVDQRTIENYGVGQLILMERAALAVADRIRRKNNESNNNNPYKRILIVSGNGNNGADGAALARMLFLDDYHVTLMVTGEISKYSSAMRSQMQILENYRTADKPYRSEGTLEICEYPDEISEAFAGRRYDVIIDAIFGVGLHREISGKYAELISFLNALDGFKLAMDIPSGVFADSGRVSPCTFRADETVTFGFRKIGQMLCPGREFCGNLICEDIGISEYSLTGDEAAFCLAKDLKAAQLLEKREEDSHKGTYGKVLLAAGSKTTPGAALLAARGAFAAGAGMVCVHTDRTNRDLLIAAVPEAMYSDADDEKSLRERMKWCDTLVIGPGLTTEESAKALLSEILKTIETDMTSYSKRNFSMVIDADGINLLAADTNLSERLYHLTASGIRCVLTPHIGELSRLLHRDITELVKDRYGLVKAFAEEHGLILVSKDSVTLTADGKNRVFINSTGNSGMATAGSGDVLAGIIGAFLAKRGNTGLSPELKDEIFEKTLIAVYLHGRAGDLAALDIGKTAMKAGDIAEHIGKLMYHL